MLAEYTKKTNIGIAVGLLLQFASVTVLGDSILGLIVLLAGIGVMIWGCSCYAKAKGQSGLLGFLAIASLLGLIILVLLPDKSK